ncbi:MAG: transaldolase [Gemmatimonadetes bacterium]|nr:transaldolase [Gemmatimonadota bacterium]
MADNRVKALRENGQAMWLDYIRRDMLESGEEKRLIEEVGLAGQTSNPTIFDEAISETDLYDPHIREAGVDTEPKDVFEGLAVADIQSACDLFRPLWEATGGEHGFVSIEVSPHLAYDTEGTVAEVRRLWQAVDRPNVMVKIPGTREGLPAIRRSLAEGMNINITLLFSVERYREVMEMWYEAMEERVERGAPVDRQASVASFFVSRVDSKVDDRLDTLLEAAEDAETRERIEGLKGQIGICNAKIAYAAFEETILDADRYAPLKESGVRCQRPLWASTSTKNPDFPDTYYVDALVAPHSVDTVPPKTLDAFLDHGDPSVSIREGLEECRERMDALASIGIDFDAVTAELEVEGVEKFGASYDALLEDIAEKQRQLQLA